MGKKQTNKQNTTNLKIQEFPTEFYIEYANELERHYAEMERKNDELAKELSSYQDLEENYYRLKLQLLKYSQYKSISREFKKKEETISFNKFNNNYSSNMNIQSTAKSNQSTFTKFNKITLQNINQRNSLKNAPSVDMSGLYNCENPKCKENKVLYEELRKMKIKLKLENEDWKKKCLDLGKVD